MQQETLTYCSKYHWRVLTVSDWQLLPAAADWPCSSHRTHHFSTISQYQT